MKNNFPQCVMASLQNGMKSRFTFLTSLDLKQISEADVYHIEILWMIYFICVQDHFDTKIIVI